MTASDETIVSAGLTVPVDPNIISPAIQKALALGTYERPRLKCIVPAIQPGDRIVEVGSGIGFLSAIMAKQAQPELVVAVDGHPALRAYAERLHALNGVPEIVSVTGLVVTQKTSEREKLYMSAEFWGSSMLPGVAHQVGVADVQTLSYSELIEDYRPTMVVIDLEVMREYLQPNAASGPLESMDLSGVDKVMVHLPIHLGGQAGIKRVFDFFSSQGFYYNIDHSRLAVVLFSRIDG